MGAPGQGRPPLTRSLAVLVGFVAMMVLDVTFR